MKKPIIRQKRFSKRSSANASSDSLPVEMLDRVSCFETLRAYGGKVFHSHEHLERLSDSCKAINRTLCPSTDEINSWLTGSLKMARLKNALLRLAVHFEEDGGRLVLFLREFKAHPFEWYQKGVALKTTVCRRWDFKAQDPQIKASQFMNGVLAVLSESGSPAHELLFFGPRGTVAEGTVSNVFIVKNKQRFGPSTSAQDGEPRSNHGAHHKLLTPAVSSGILRGVTRAVVIHLAQQRGIKVNETLLTRHELYTADECFMTNTSSEVLPVVSIDGRTIGTGFPGPVTKLLATDFTRVTR